VAPLSVKRSETVDSGAGGSASAVDAGARSAVGGDPRDAEHDRHLARRREAEHRFCEQLALTQSSEIIAMLDAVLADHFMEFSVWSRMLACRLAWLLEPDNAAIRRRAAAHLRLFGPDWDDQADALDREAARIESKSQAP
jgi:hypothetical protein